VCVILFMCGLISEDEASDRSESGGKRGRRKTATTNVSKHLFVFFVVKTIVVFACANDEL
jgi:hypothetical protein